jgi:predicted nucleotidyltransferase
MRLSTEVKNQIVTYAQYHFGDAIKLYLFGSRVYDNKKGGDIDLFIENSKRIDMKVQMTFLKDIYKHVTQRKIDLLIKSSSAPDKPVFHTAKHEGILLC